MIKKISIVGARGYTGQELIKILTKHKEVEIISLFASEKLKTKIPIENEFFNFKKLISLDFEPFSLDKVKNDLDLVFLNVPHTVAMEYAPLFLEKGIKVIDLSADFRIKDKATYNKWYNIDHNCPEYIEKATYGLTELNRENIKTSNFIANPGCYPTGIILSSAPVLKHKLVSGKGIVVDSKSGVSGAGRKESLAFSFVECNENMKAYRIAAHQHTPEIEQEISALAGEEIKISFTPHLIPINRGMLNTLYFDLIKPATTAEVIDIYKNYYKNDFFVRILEAGNYPETKNVLGQNFCDIAIKIDSRTNKLIVISVIDNLIKGASGQAVQNMNIMYNFNETEGLV